MSHVTHKKETRMNSRYSQALMFSAALLLLGAPAQADVFVSSEKDNAILQMDADGKVIRSLPVCLRPRHMAWAQGGKQIMMACGDSNQIGVLDLASGKLIDSIKIPCDSVTDLSIGETSPRHQAVQC